MLSSFEAEFHNASSLYAPARAVAGQVEEARRELAELLGLCEPRELIFTSGATESNNAALFGAFRANPTRRHIVTTAVEHPSVLEVCGELERQGCEITHLPVDHRGLVNGDALLSALRPTTLLVSVMHANNETGVLQDVDSLAAAVKRHDAAVLFHTDATQSVGKVALKLSEAESAVDLLSLSAHKFHGPKGTGALFVRDGTMWRPFLRGGHQEDGRRAGTYNAPGIIGLGTAAKLALDERQSMSRIRELRDALEDVLLARVSGLVVNGREAPRLPNTSSLSFENVEGESLLQRLDARGIYVSTGSACTSGSVEPSHVLRAMRVDKRCIHGSIRLSFSRYTTEGEVNKIGRVLISEVEKLRSLSPHGTAARTRASDNGERYAG